LENLKRAVRKMSEKISEILVKNADVMHDVLYVGDGCGG
jgi:hypothetical protein